MHVTHVMGPSEDTYLITEYLSVQVRFPRSHSIGSRRFSPFFATPRQSYELTEYTISTATFLSLYRLGFFSSPTPCLHFAQPEKYGTRQDQLWTSQLSP